MKKSLSLSLKNLIYNKKFLIAASVLLSVIIWFAATIVRNPERNQTFTDIPVNVSVDNTAVSSMGLGIVSDISSARFTVTVKGPNHIVSSLKKSDFVLSASVDGVNAPGTYSLKVSGAAISDKTGYEFASIEPSSIDVTFDYIDNKIYTVTPKITGVSAAEGLVAETPIISNKDQTEITVKGPRSILSKIESVGSITEIRDGIVLSASETYDSDIVLFDKNGDVLYRYDSSGDIFDGHGEKVSGNSLSLSFTTVKVTQPISRKAVLDVAVNFQNMPSGITKEALEVNLDHKTVTVIGTPDIVDKMTEVTLENIDFKDISVSSCEFSLKASLPDGVRIFDNIETFTVKLNLKGFAEKVFNVSNVEYKGLSDTLNAKASTVRNVKICAPVGIIKDIKASDLSAVVDLSGKTAGDHTVDVAVKSAKFNNIWQVGSYNLSVTISNK